MRATDTDKPIDTLEGFHERLGKILEQYGDDHGANLPAEHPVHMLARLHDRIGRQLDETKRRKEAEAEGDADSGWISHDAALPSPTGHADVVRKAFLDVVEDEAARLAARTGCSVEKAFVTVLDQRQNIHKMFTPTPDLGGHTSAAQAAAWGRIEAEADSLVAKSATGMTREKAIDRVMKSNPALTRAYYGIDGDLVG